MVKIKFIDFGGYENCRSTKLMQLPEQMRACEPLACEIRVVNLVPYDFDDIFDNETRSAVEQSIRKIHAEGDYFVCDIEMAVNETIITTNFNIFKKLTNIKTDIMKLSLKKLLLENNYAMRKDDVLENLKEIAAVSNFELPEKVICEKIERISDEKPEILKSNDRELSIGITYKAKLLNFHSAETFYIQVIDKNYESLKVQLEEIENCENRAKLDTISKNSLCLVDFEDGKLMRCVIIRLDPLEVFLVDYGVEKKTEPENLYQISNKYAHLLPFQAVKCGLKGLKEKKMYGIKNKLGFRKIFHEISKNEIFSIEVHSKSNNKYLVSVYDTEKDINIKDVALEQKIVDLNQEGKCDVELQNAIKGLIEMMQEDANKDMSGISQKKLNKMIGLPENTRILPPENSNTDDHIKKDSKIVKCNPKANPEKSIVDQKFCKDVLENIYANMVIEWSQNDEIIMLKIEALNPEEYSLKVTKTDVEICIKYPDRTALAIIELYGRVVPSHVSHKSNGIEITVFLAKKFKAALWPRLSFTRENNAVIKYSYNPLKLSLSGRNINKKRVVWMPAGFYSDEEDNCEYDDKLDKEDVI